MGDAKKSCFRVQFNRRIKLEFSLGRDLVVEPLPPNGPINFLMYPIFETQGRERILVPDLFFKRIKRRNY